MAKLLPIPRKQRTRKHVIADQSINHVERYVFEAGFTVERVRYDYGYDQVIFTYDGAGFIEPDWIPIQVKAMERPRENASGTHIRFDITIEDYNLWTSERLPVFLIVFDAIRKRAYWLYVQQYFQRNPTRRPRLHAAFVRVTIPKTQRVNRKWVEFARRCKENISIQDPEEIDHG